MTFPKEACRPIQIQHTAEPLSLQVVSIILQRCHPSYCSATLIADVAVLAMAAGQGDG